MENIIQIKGNVKFSITMDPGVWIFDDRKVDLTTYFLEDHQEQDDELAKYKKDISKQWDREITEGATIPPTSSTKPLFEKEKLLNGTFAIPFKPFLKNAEVGENAKALIIKTSDSEVEIPIDEAFKLLLGFSLNGKPLREDGPIHVYYGDGSNQNKPITNVIEMRVI
ncbi:peptidyl-prolyl cis-trans isomerase [Bacillus marasmi]|uniref:peptidyl-prolyl cis-trans isomerase n=1 Tax=Bacillus marasmi TaxID=1926279 RepID=UPI0011CA3F36|nr:peptidyl-prolyl cis-trans isomerase [Bacillus marasmi]